MTEAEQADDEGFYDDSGRWWPSNAEWCDRCQGMGTEECMCAGDFCCCGAGDNLECRRCHGDGYYILTPAMKQAGRMGSTDWLSKVCCPLLTTWRNVLTFGRLRSSSTNPSTVTLLPAPGDPIHVRPPHG